MVHYYYGDGKGKTTAAAGLAVRAAGCGMKAAFLQFLKDGKSSEVSSLEKLGITTLSCGSGTKFVWNMNDAEKKELAEKHTAMLKQAAEGEYDLIVLDELGDAYSLGLADSGAVKDLLEMGKRIEIVVTGHQPDSFFTEKADYCTEMRKEKHPFDNGTAARRGIEY